MKLTELAKTDLDPMTEADQEWEATLRQHASDGTLATIGEQVKELFEADKTDPL